MNRNPSVIRVYADFRRILDSACGFGYNTLVKWTFLLEKNRKVEVKMAKKNILTYEGLQKLEEELQNLKVVKRHEIAQKIKEAREQEIGRAHV